MEQYGIRLSEVNMSWREFVDLLSCISADTPLGKIISIRSETDGEVLKNFTPAQNKIRNEWLERNKTDNEKAAEYENSMQALFNMALA